MAALLANQNINNPAPQNNNNTINDPEVESNNKDEDEEYEEEVPHRCQRVVAEEKNSRHCEIRIPTEIPKFHGSLQAEKFLDWLATVEEIFEFKGVPENKRVSLIATRLRGRATAWWQQLN